jgi:hypothetical protein
MALAGRLWSGGWSEILGTDEADAQLAQSSQGRGRRVDLDRRVGPARRVGLDRQACSGSRLNRPVLRYA